ncbi:MAG: hypothetical protein ACREN7_03590 [Candidatus Dormibacteria bacterium]
MSQVNVIVVNIRRNQAQEYQELFQREELPRWRRYQAEGKFVSARFYRSEFGSQQDDEVVKFVIVVEVPSMAEHSAHDQDPGFQKFDAEAERFQPAAPLVFGGDLIHSVG